MAKITTIAWDGKTLAVDSLMSCGTTAFGSTTKLYKLKDGRHAAFAGCMSLVPEMLAWLEGGAKPVLDPEKDEIVGLIVDKKGVAFEFGEDLRVMPACVPWAGGSGQSFALAAMMLGKTAEEAVELGCVLDINSRGPVQSVKICK